MDANSIAIIIVAAIGAIATIISNIFVSNKQSREMDAKLDKNQGVIEERINNLKESVEKHNNFAVQIPEIRSDIKNLEKRVDKLEAKISK